MSWDREGQAANGRKRDMNVETKSLVLALCGNKLRLLVSKFMGSLKNDKYLTFKFCNKCYKANFLGNYQV